MIKHLPWIYIFVFICGLETLAFIIKYLGNRPTPASLKLIMFSYVPETYVSQTCMHPFCCRPLLFDLFIDPELIKAILDKWYSVQSLPVRDNPMPLDNIIMFGPCGPNILSFVWISMFLIFYVRALFLPEFLSNRLQTSAQWSLGM